MIFRRRPFQLLEVLIALLLVMVGLIPLIQSQTRLYQEQRVFAIDQEADHAARLVSAYLIQKLYRQEITWDMLFAAQPQPVNYSDDQWPALPSLPYAMQVSFQQLKAKGKDQQVPKEEQKNHLFEATLHFLPTKNAKERKYRFHFFIEREEEVLHA